ncbi:MerR family transcriptional regulator [Klenkia terrae]|uniref:MerR family transcriptional regulator n=1 Tax=Klenkia terrae TaxID=1052259 RepID=UPI001CD8DFD7|nr:MerR family transcriptional regulator [Klenkia terrae]
MTTIPALGIAEAAQRSGLTPHTLRYYERDGLLLAAVDRDAGGRRRYTERDLEWLAMLAALRATGMPIRDVRRYAALVRGGAGSEAERLTLLQDHRDRVQAQLAETARHLDAIDAKVDRYRAQLSS